MVARRIGQRGSVSVVFAAVLSLGVVFVGLGGTNILAMFLLVCAAWLVGFVYGRSRSKAAEPCPEVEQEEGGLLRQDPAGGEEKERVSGRGDSEPMREILYVLQSIQDSDDVLERYQWFTRITERILSESIGNCCVSLWCPDEPGEELVECLIPKGGGAIRGGLREPCRVALESPLILKSLQTGCAYLVEDVKEESEFLVQQGRYFQRCQGCIPLSRPYGRDLLILIHRTEGLAGTESGVRVDTSQKERFETAAQLVEMIWQQLQAANQRQWRVEHDASSEVLRGEVFLEQGQARVEELSKQDELFAFVVLTVRGFRSMFAGQSDHWRYLSGMVGRGLKTVLTKRGEEFLLGRMADDVFALFLIRKDSFLAEGMMKKVLKDVCQEIVSESRRDDPSWRGPIDIQWEVADRRQYRGDLEKTMNGIYQKMFRQDGSDVSRRFVIEAGALETVVG